MHVRTYGESGRPVLVLHGGPGAPGCVAPVARGLASSFRVLEPFQRGSSDTALTVARHVEDLDDLVRSRCAGTRPALVGSSWGAMLALAYAAAHPTQAGPLVLIGCGTFDTRARDRMREILDERMSDHLRMQLDAIDCDAKTPDDHFRRTGECLLPVYSVSPVSTDLELEACDAGAYQETWSDMLRLQTDGTYPAAFSDIVSPVLMLHGADDPHPGPMIRDSLRPHIPQLEYREWARCGHYPWLEAAVHEEFFAVLRGWLARNSA